ncbi:hypothetical protein BH10BAC2_BH10BAC2_03490 [soil metagenome]
MRLVILFLLVVTSCFFVHAQKSRYDSIRKIIQQDSIEYEQQLRDADRIKNQTDSLLKKDLGHIERITPGSDSATIIKNLRALAAAELQKQQEEENKRYYLFVGALIFFLIAVIMIFKRKQLQGGDNKKL